MQPGDIVIAKITSIVGYGAFVSVGEYLGLVHISEFSDNYVKSIKEFVSVGQEIRLRVLEIDEEKKKVKLIAIINKVNANNHNNKQNLKQNDDKIRKKKKK